MKYAHGFVVLCFVVVMQSFIMNSHEVFIHIHQGCFAGTGTIVRLPHCHWSKPDGYGKISQCITTTKHSKTKTVCIFLGIYCILQPCYGVSNYLYSHFLLELLRAWLPVEWINDVCRGMYGRRGVPVVSYRRVWWGSGLLSHMGNMWLLAKVTHCDVIHRGYPTKRALSAMRKHGG